MKCVLNILHEENWKLYIHILKWGDYKWRLLRPKGNFAGIEGCIPLFAYISRCKTIHTAHKLVIFY